MFPIPAAESERYLVCPFWDISLEPCLATISQGTMVNNLGTVTGTERVSLVVTGSIPSLGMKSALGV